MPHYKSQTACQEASMYRFGYEGDMGEFLHNIQPRVGPSTKTFMLGTAAVVLFYAAKMSKKRRY